jgi:putative endonuclease
VDWYVYIIENASKDRLYTGIAINPEKRLIEHNTNSRGARATRAGRPWKLVYRETSDSRGAALSREYKIKRMTRAQKLAIIETTSG